MQIYLFGSLLTKRQDAKDIDLIAICSDSCGDGQDLDAFTPVADASGKNLDVFLIAADEQTFEFDMSDPYKWNVPLSMSQYAKGRCKLWVFKASYDPSEGEWEVLTRVVYQASTSMKLTLRTKLHQKRC